VNAHLSVREWRRSWPKAAPSRGRDRRSARKACAAQAVVLAGIGDGLVIRHEGHFLSRHRSSHLRQRRTPAPCRWREFKWMSLLPSVSPAISADVVETWEKSAGDDVLEICVGETIGVAGHKTRRRRYVGPLGPRQIEVCYRWRAPADRRPQGLHSQHNRAVARGVVIAARFRCPRQAQSLRRAHSMSKWLLPKPSE